MIAVAAEPEVSRENEASPTPAAPAPLGDLLWVPTRYIEMRDNVRSELGDLEELAASIAELGILEPITVTQTASLTTSPDDPHYIVKTGHRRLAAAKLAGLEVVPAIIDGRRELGEHGGRRSIEQLSENLFRADVNPIDQARALREILASEKGLTQAMLAKRLGRSAPWVANTIALLKAAPEIQAYVAEGKLSAAHVRAIGGLPASEQRDLADAAVDEGMSAHELEVSAQEIRGHQQDLAKRTKDSKAAAERAVTALREAEVSTDVRVYVTAAWTLDREIIVTAVAAAGWQVTQQWGGPVHPDCNCRDVHLNLGDATKGAFTVSRMCTNESHAQAMREQRDRDSQEQAKRNQSERDALKAAATARLAVVPLDPTVGRLLLRQMENYNGHTWPQYLAMPDAEVASQIADRLFWPGGVSKPIPAGVVLEALGAPEALAPEPKPKGKRARPQVSLDEAIETSPFAVTEIAQADFAILATADATVQSEAAARVAEKRAARLAAAPVKGLPTPVVHTTDSALDDMPEVVEAARKAGR